MSAKVKNPEVGQSCHHCNAAIRLFPYSITLPPMACRIVGTESPWPSRTGAGVALYALEDAPCRGEATLASSRPSYIPALVCSVLRFLSASSDARDWYAPESLSKQTTRGYR
jgi:hypothetical protein